MPSILSDYTLKSTIKLVNLSSLPDKTRFLKTRRENHVPIKIGEFEIFLRDQHTLSEAIVMKNMTTGWTFQDFVYTLNSRVFFWSTEKDLRSHYKRYEKQGEYPLILRANTSEVFEINNRKPEFCKYNSGGPRCHHTFTKGAAPRGANSFLNASKYPDVYTTVREVTFTDMCVLPRTIFLSSHPDKAFKVI